jgi:hypothetical protein
MDVTAARPEVASPASYQQKLLGLLAARNPLDVLTATPDAVARLLAPHPADVLRRRPFPDRRTWTPLEILGHLIDAELVYAFRIRLILCEDRPTILGMDQEKWVAGQRYNERDPDDLLTDFRAARSINLKLWRQIRPDQLDRVGLHNERGEESLGLMLRMHAGHDLSHLDQITRYLAAIVRS